MQLDFLIEAPVGLLPVLVFLAVLHHWDGHKLVGLKAIVPVLLAGGLLAVASYFVNGYLLDALNIEFKSYSRYIAPIVEESLKAGVLIYLFARNRVGFMVDAAI